MEKVWIILTVCFVLVATMAQCGVVPPAGGVAVPAVKEIEEGEKVVIQEEENLAIREAELIRQFGQWLYYHQVEEQSTRSGGNKLNLGSGCDCSFQVFCTRDSDCKNRGLETGGIQTDNTNCKMDCCGSRCD